MHTLKGHASNLFLTLLGHSESICQALLKHAHSFIQINMDMSSDAPWHTFYNASPTSFIIMPCQDMYFFPIYVLEGKVMKVVIV